MSNSSNAPHPQSIVPAIDDDVTGTIVPLAQKEPEGQRPKRLTLKVTK